LSAARRDGALMLAKDWSATALGIVLSGYGDLEVLTDSANREPRLASRSTLKALGFWLIPFRFG